MQNNSIYNFNPDDIRFDRSNTGLKNKFLKFLTFFSIVIVLAIVFNILFSSFFYTPKERALFLETKTIETKYKEIYKRYKETRMVLNDIEKRDSNIYRAIFENEPSFNSFESFTSNNADAITANFLDNLNKTKLIIENKDNIEKLMIQMSEQTQLMNKIITKITLKKDYVSHLPAIQPVKNENLKRTAAGYGWKMHPIYKIKKFHQGIDFTAPIGTKIYATANGKVKKIFRNPHTRDGNKIIIDHENGYVTLYAHLQKINVNWGQQVKRGDIIGYVGSTGLSTAPHLHYEIIKNGKQVNPAYYFFNDLQPEQYQKLIAIAARTSQSFD